MSEFDKDAVIRRISGLLSKTVSNGCSEAEAMAAAKMAGDIMNKYQLSLSDIKLREEVCEQIRINTHLKDGGPMFWIIKAIAYYTDTRSWRTTYSNGPAWFQFFGFKTDVAVAGYLHDMLSRAIVYAWEDYRLSLPGYTRLPGSRKTALKNGFYIGICNRLSERLHAMKDAQRAENRASAGRDLVLVKMPRVEEEFAKLGLELRTKNTRNMKADFEAYLAGKSAADDIGLNPGVEVVQKNRIG
jgi:hypothetical protein